MPKSITVDVIFQNIKYHRNFFVLKNNHWSKVFLFGLGRHGAEELTIQINIKISITPTGAAGVTHQEFKGAPLIFCSGQLSFETNRGFTIASGQQGQRRKLMIRREILNIFSIYFFFEEQSLLTLLHHGHQ